MKGIDKDQPAIGLVGLNASLKPPIAGAIGFFDLFLSGAAVVRGFGAASAKTTGHPRFAVVTTRRTEQPVRKLKFDLFFKSGSNVLLG